MVEAKEKRDKDLWKVIKKYRQEITDLKEKISVYMARTDMLQNELARQTVEKAAMIKLVSQFYEIAAQVAAQSGIHPPLANDVTLSTETPTPGTG